MKKTLLIGLLVLSGCPSPMAPPATVPNTQTSEAPATGPTININIRKSARYMAGYWDGFHGGWLAPFRYSVADEYRNGWQQGRADKKAGLQARFNEDGSLIEEKQWTPGIKSGAK